MASSITELTCILGHPRIDITRHAKSVIETVLALSCAKGEISDVLSDLGCMIQCVIIRDLSFTSLFYRFLGFVTIFERLVTSIYDYI
jgi:hypothetical protein